MTADSRPDRPAWIVLATYEIDHGRPHPLTAVHA
ncbi:hypothetical protein RKD49_005559 [Streptomyces glaucescens]